MVPIKEALTFDDVTMAPKYSEILPSEVDTKVILSKYLSLKIPLLSSAMDTVTESKMAIALAKLGGIGIIHRNLDIKKQIVEIKKVKSKGLIVSINNVISLVLTGQVRTIRNYLSFPSFLICSLILVAEICCVFSSRTISSIL